MAVLALGVVLGFAFNTNATAAEKLVNYMVKDGAIAKSLTGKPGDAAKGRKVAIDRKKGNCLACHKMPIPEQSFHGEVGPDLAGVGGRLSAGQIRLRIVDPERLGADSIMPPFYKLAGLHGVLKKFKGKTIISASDVEDLVAYMMTLK
ncbi:MAG: sulfur oxidation c-type cytochrome SoxX [Proteobacteria bacterium]|nr:sulfur oxidation c-type cytochrome SoxX [Pseudomonadota bacterium]